MTGKHFTEASGEVNVYRGESRTELEEAWHRLIQHTNVRVSAEDLRKTELLLLFKTGAGDYLASLGVFHPLHCLKYMRNVIEFGTNETPRLPEYLDHCLDSIRQLLMCKAYVLLTTFDWV
jgi:hypothetical protein